MPKTKELKEKMEALKEEVKNYQFSHNDNWELLINGSTSFGSPFRAYSFAQDWAKLMEHEITTGKKLSDVHKECFDKANLENISEFKLNCAIFSLINCWDHGDKLAQIYF